MKRISARLTAALALGLALAVSAEERIITLVDGSRIRAEILTMQQDRYMVRNPALGTIELDADRIASIAAPGSDGGASAAAAGPGNAALMSAILQLQNDPEVQAVLSDPALMRAVQRFDLDALSRNPKIQALMNNPRVRSIYEQVE